MDGQTLESLADLICGDGEDSPVYRSGPKLTSFFKRVGFSNFVHDRTTRKWWTLDVLNQLTDKGGLPVRHLFFHAGGGNGNR